MLSVLDRLLKICTSSESAEAVAALLRFLATLTYTQRSELEAVVYEYYRRSGKSAVKLCDATESLMAASIHGNDYEKAALIMERMTASNRPAQVKSPEVQAADALLDLSSATKKDRSDTILSPAEVHSEQLESAKKKVRADKSLRPSRINEIRTWLLSLPQGSEVTYNMVASMWYQSAPERAGSAFSQLCCCDKALKRVGHARYRLVRGAKGKLIRGLKYFSGKKYRPEKTLFD